MSSENKYVMGIDEGGYDGNTFAICVIKKEGFIVEYIKSFRDEDFYKREVERLADFYNIPKNLILKETD